MHVMQYRILFLYLSSFVLQQSLAASIVAIKAINKYAIPLITPGALSFYPQQLQLQEPLPFLPTTFVEHATTVALALQGGQGEPLYDLTRVRIRLEGLHLYEVVTALFMNAALRLFLSTPKTLKAGEKSKNIAKILFTIAIGCSVIAGAYTTVVFTLLGLYSKSAIGLGKDLAFVAFFDATASIRRSAFVRFILTLISFELSFVMSLFLNYEGRMRWCASGIAAVATLTSWWGWNHIMGIAGQLLFK
jgi:hypothetical protein